MFGFGGPNEFLIIVLVVAVLTMTGLWPKIIHGLRELRGDDVGPPPGNGPAPPHGEVEMCYKILGLSPTATWKDIEAAYRKKAKIHHPDHGGDEDAMRALNDAYTQLKRERRA
jgi:hypothetical protein